MPTMMTLPLIVFLSTLLRRYDCATITALLCPTIEWFDHIVLYDSDAFFTRLPSSNMYGYIIDIVFIHICGAWHIVVIVYYEAGIFISVGIRILSWIKFIISGEIINRRVQTNPVL